MSIYHTPHALLHQSELWLAVSWLEDRHHSDWPKVFHASLSFMWVSLRSSGLAAARLDGENQFTVTMNEGHQRWRIIFTDFQSKNDFGKRINCSSLGRNNDVRTMEVVILHVISFPGDRKLLISQSSDASWSHPSSTKQEQTTETPKSHQLNENTDRFKRVSVLTEVFTWRWHVCGDICDRCGN